MMKRLIATGLMVAVAINLWAQAPEMFRYQGRLLDGTNLVNATVPMSFKLYAAQSGGTRLYEDSNSVLVADGLYSTFIGDDTVYGSLTNALTNAMVYLELTINGETLSPRERLVSVPYALCADVDLTGYVQTTNSVYTETVANAATALKQAQADLLYVQTTNSVYTETVANAATALKQAQADLLYAPTGHVTVVSAALALKADVSTVLFDPNKAGGSFAPEDEIIMHPYTGGLEVVHPSVAVMPDPFNGYKYWMAYTPYTNGDQNFEQPSIEASTDGTTWVVPAGVSNPLAGKPPAGWNSDPVLFYDSRTLYLVYRTSHTNCVLNMFTSTNGVNWAGPVSILSLTNSINGASPSILKGANGYMLWAVDTAPATNLLRLWTAPAMSGPWTNTATCSLSQAIPDIWHIEVRRVCDQYVMMYLVNTDVPQGLYLATSPDGINWLCGTNRIAETYVTLESLYKSSFHPVWINGKLKLRTWLGFFNSSTNVHTYRFANMYIDVNDPDAKYTADVLNELMLSKSGVSADWTAYDTFNRANTTNSLGTADSGHAWTATGSSILSNQAKSTTGSTAAQMINLGFARQTVQARFFYPTSPLSNCYLRANYGSATNYVLFGCGPNTMPYIALYWQGHTVTTGGHYRVKINSGDWLKLEVLSNRVSGYINNRLIIRTTVDPTNMPDGTQCGVVLNHDPMRVDNFMAK